MQLKYLSSTFRAASRPSDNFRQLSVQVEDLPSTSINFPCSRETFRQLPPILCAAWRPSINLRQLSVQPEDLPSTSVHFSCCRQTFRQLFVSPGDIPSTSVNFPCSRETFIQLPSTFLSGGTLFVNIHQISLQPGDLSTFRAAGRLSVHFVNIPCSRETLCLLLSFSVRPDVARRPSVNFRSLSMRSENFRQFSSMLHAGGRYSINFHQLSKRPG